MAWRWRLSITAGSLPSDSLATGQSSLATIHSPLTTCYSPLSLRLPQALSLPSRAGTIESHGSLQPSLGTAPSAANRLRSRPSGSADDDLTFIGSELCVDFGWASLGAFWGVFAPPGRPCRSQSPWQGRTAASALWWDKIPILSFVESSMTRLESCPSAPVIASNQQGEGCIA